MAEEPDNITLRLLREMRVILDEHSQAFVDLNKKIDDWQETTATAVGLAVHSNLRNKAIEDELAELARRVEGLERAR